MKKLLLSSLLYALACSSASLEEDINARMEKVTKSKPFSRFRVDIYVLAFSRQGEIYSNQEEFVVLQKEFLDYTQKAKSLQDQYDALQGDLISQRKIVSGKMLLCKELEDKGERVDLTLTKELEASNVDLRRIESEFHEFQSQYAPVRDRYNKKIEEIIEEYRQALFAALS